MNRRRLLASAAWAPLVAVPAAAGAQAPLQLGVLPHVSPRVLLVNYQPLRSHLEKAVERPVEIATAANFRDYHARAVAGNFEVAITAANLGRVSLIDGTLVGSAIFEPSIPGLLVMLKDRPVVDVEELRGRLLALSNPASLVALKGLAWLRERRLSAGTDFRTVHAANEDSLGQLLRSGEAPLAMMSAGEFKAVPEGLRDQLAILTEFAQVPGFMVMQKPGGDPDLAARIRHALMGFMATEDGRQFTRLTGTRTIRAIRPDDLRLLDDVVDETRRLLA
ncbi:MAG: PhnD/SsuA/transferrin family substrate-binding protein [Alphaproteobacteria bacterium]|nr:PhnD/SsuA/transferrin family substrate-binding protein [Alphaproteobacteria bacterium]